VAVTYRSYLPLVHEETMVLYVIVDPLLKTLKSPLAGDANVLI
jgi:hypothetical protein